MIRLISAKIGYKHPILEVSAEFSGKIFLLGPNGSGKTTLFRAICGIANVFSGKIEVSGKDPKVVPNLSEILLIMYAKAKDIIALRADLLRADEGEIINYLRSMSLSPDILSLKPSELSSGQLKSLLNAIALGSRPEHALLDEPFEGLDPGRKVALMGLLDEYPGSVMVSTHETSFVTRLKNRSVYFMFSGRLYGPFKGEELENAGIVQGKRDDALVTIETPMGYVSIVPNEGRPLTAVYSLDQLYTIFRGNILARQRRDSGGKEKR